MSERNPNMTFKAYNGWAGEIRSVRGNRMYKDLKTGAMKAGGKCVVCGNVHGLTFHTEEYGSTYQDFENNAKELCPVCHGIIHLRFQFPNRWRRYKARMAKGEKAHMIKNIGLYFGIMRGLKDIPEQEEVPSGIDWLDAISLVSYKGPPKIAVVEYNHVLIPDPAIYDMHAKVEGVIWSAETGELTPYFHDRSDLFGTATKAAD